MRYRELKKEILKEQFQRNPNRVNLPLLTEATYVAPVSAPQIREFRQLLSTEIPASLAIFLIHDVLHDDELFNELQSFALIHPSEDARDIIANWASNNMPHLLISHYDYIPNSSLLGSLNMLT